MCTFCTDGRFFKRVLIFASFLFWGNKMCKEIIEKPQQKSIKPFVPLQYFGRVIIVNVQSSNFFLLEDWDALNMHIKEFLRPESICWAQNLFQICTLSLTLILDFLVESFSTGHWRNAGCFRKNRNYWFILSIFQPLWCWTDDIFLIKDSVKYTWI